MIWINNKSRANHTEWLCLVENYTSLRCPRNWPTSHIHVKQQEISKLYMFFPNGDVIWIVILTRDWMWRINFWDSSLRMKEPLWLYHRWDMWSLQMGDETPKTKVELQRKGLENDAMFCCFGFYISAPWHLYVTKWPLNGQPPRHTHKHTTLNIWICIRTLTPSFSHVDTPIHHAKNHSQPILSFHKPATLTTSGMVFPSLSWLVVKTRRGNYGPYPQTRKTIFTIQEQKNPTGTFHGEKKLMFV